MHQTTPGTNWYRALISDNLSQSQKKCRVQLQSKSYFVRCSPKGLLSYFFSPRRRVQQNILLSTRRHRALTGTERFFFQTVKKYENSFSLQTIKQSLMPCIRMSKSAFRRGAKYTKHLTKHQTTPGTNWYRAFISESEKFFSLGKRAFAYQDSQVRNLVFLAQVAHSTKSVTKNVTCKAGIATGTLLNSRSYLQSMAPIIMRG